MDTKKITVSMVSDDIDVHCWNASEGEDVADWQMYIKGNVVVGYSVFWTNVELKERTMWVPPRDEGEGLNYCIQKKCEDQRSLWSTNSSFGNLNDWNATVKISAAMNQNVNVNTIPSITQQFVEMGKDIKIPIEWLEAVGDKCPDLEDVQRALSIATDIPWWELDDSGELKDLPPMKLDEFKNCEDPTKPKKGMAQGAGDVQDKINKGKAPKLLQRFWDKTSEIIVVQAFQYVDKGIKSIPYMDEGLQILTIIKDENKIPLYKFPINWKLCECSKKGLSDKCWRCEKVLKSKIVLDDVGAMIETETVEIECIQDVTRDAEGNCPSHSTGGARAHEREEDCELYKTIDCKGTGDPNQ